MIRWLTRLLPAVLLVVALPITSARCEATVNARQDIFDARYVVNDDQTYTETVTSEVTPLTPLGIRQHDRAAVTFYPKSQTLEVLEAWVDQPDGARLQVPPDGRFTRPSAASQSAPGFTGSMTTTVVFPQLRPGSRTHIVWRRTQTTPPNLGFSAWSIATLEEASVIDHLAIDAPAGLALHWAVRGPVATTDSTQGARRHITADMPPQPGARPEPAAVSPSDFQPLFVASTLPDVATIGTRYAELSAGRAEPTPEIAALAARIVDGRQGLEAARALYDWVSTNIRYIALTLNIEDGWVPHPAAEVLHNGYGDCKDHAALLEALLAARGIAAQTALIDWGSRTRDLPIAHPAEFNHAIVYLPAYDRWLNPTNPYAPFDSLDHTLAGKRVALAGLPGREAHTPEATPADDRTVLASTAVLEADGTLTGMANWSLSPNADATFRAWLAASRSPRDLLERLMVNTPEGGFGSFASSDPRDLALPLEVSASWHSPHAVTPPAPETTITVPASPDVQPVSALRRYLSSTGQRRTPLLIGPADITWTTALTLPPGLEASRLPVPVEVANPAGSYASRSERSGASLTVVRHLVIARNIYQPDEYPALESLLYAALADARATLTLTRTAP